MCIEKYIDWQKMWDEQVNLLDELDCLLNRANGYEDYEIGCAENISEFLSSGASICIDKCRVASDGDGDDIYVVFAFNTNDKIYFFTFDLYIEEISFVCSYVEIIEK